MTPSVCPYCAQPIAEVESTIDHIFGEALGGRAVVPACAPCNNDRLGRDIEGALQRPDQFLNLFKQTRKGGAPLRGVAEGLGPVEYDLSTEQLRSRKPVTRADDGSLIVSGSPAQVRQILKQQGRTQEEIYGLMSDAEQVDVAHFTFTTDLKLSIRTGTRLIAKIALGAGTLVDTAFISSPLAEELRQVLATGSDRLEIGAGLISAIGDKLTELLGEPVISPVRGQNQVTFVPLPAGGTGVLVHLDGLSMFGSGLALTAPMPFGEGMPVAFCDREGGWVARRVADQIAAARALTRRGSDD